jgi:ABC-type transporter MlaC component
MKILKTGAICVLACLCYVHTAAQQNQQPAVTEKSGYVKPRIFADLPSKLQLNVSMLENMLNDEVGTRVSFALGQGYQFQGLVVSKSDAIDKHTRTVVVKATNRQGVALTFTRHTNDDGTYTYSGRMLSFKHGDAFEIMEEAGHLVMVKKDQHDLLEE